MDWNDGAARLRLIEQVGHDEYNRRLREHLDSSVIATVNNHGIRTVMSRFGLLYAVNGTKMAFASRKQAEDYARTL
jgi:hypothetical protein